MTDDAGIRKAADRFADYIRGETLTVRLVFEPLPGVEPVEVKISGAAVKLYLQVVYA